VLNLSGWRERGFYGRSYRVKQDIAAQDLIVRLQKTLDHEVEVLEHQFSRNLVRTAAGEGRFVGPHQIEITAANGETKTVSAAHILIACGTRPFRPDYVPFDSKTVFDSDEIIDLPKLPRSLTVIGAGVIGVEYATIFSALDVAVTLIEPRPTFLDFTEQTTSFDDMAALEPGSGTVTGFGEPQQVPALRVTTNYLSVLGIAPGPVLGRAYKHLLAVRLDEGPLGKDLVRERLLSWWAEQPESQG